MTATPTTQCKEARRSAVRSSDGAAVVISLKNPNGLAVANPVPLVMHGPIDASLTYISRIGDFATYDFGLRYGARGRPGLFDAPGTPEPIATPSKSIITVRAFNPPYQIVDVGDTALDEVSPAHHLRLTPVSRIRDTTFCAKFGSIARPRCRYATSWNSR